MHIPKIPAAPKEEEPSQDYTLLKAYDIVLPPYEILEAPPAAIRALPVPALRPAPVIETFTPLKSVKCSSGADEVMQDMSAYREEQPEWEVMAVVEESEETEYETEIVYVQEQTHCVPVQTC